MRMLFFTAAAIAANLATLAQSVKLNFSNYTDDALLNMKDTLFPDMTDVEFTDMLSAMEGYGPNGANKQNQ